MATDAELPDAEALLAGTMALMSAWAHPCPSAKLPPLALKNVLRKKIVSNLFFLHHHPLVSPHLRQIARNLHLQWQTEATLWPSSASGRDSLSTGPCPPPPAALH